MVRFNNTNLWIVACAGIESWFAITMPKKKCCQFNSFAYRCCNHGTERVRAAVPNTRHEDRRKAPILGLCFTPDWGKKQLNKISEGDQLTLEIPDGNYAGARGASIIF